MKDYLLELLSLLLMRSPLSKQLKEKFMEEKIVFFLLHQEKKIFLFWKDL